MDDGLYLILVDRYRLVSWLGWAGKYEWLSGWLGEVAVTSTLLYASRVVTGSGCFLPTSHSLPSFFPSTPFLPPAQLPHYFCPSLHSKTYYPFEVSRIYMPSHIYIYIHTHRCIPSFWAIFFWVRMEPVYVDKLELRNRTDALTLCRSTVYD